MPALDQPEKPKGDTINNDINEPGTLSGEQTTGNGGATFFRNPKNRRFLIRLLVLLTIGVLLFYTAEYIFRWVVIPFRDGTLPIEADCDCGTSVKGVTPAGKAIYYFGVNLTQMMLLLVGLIFLVGIIRSFFTAEKTRAILAGRWKDYGIFIAAVLGIVTPFCSCSAIPLFIGFVTAGVPLGVTFTFLLSTSLVDLTDIVIITRPFGWEVGLIYAWTGLMIAIGSGWIIQRLKLEHWIQDWVYQLQAGQALQLDERLTFSDRMERGVQAVRDIIGKIWYYIPIGIGVGAIIHGWMPEDYLANLLGTRNWWSVPVAVLAGVPIYSNPAGIAPLAFALFEKGAALGTVLAFIMAVIGLSLPEMIILRQVLKLPLIATFLGIVTFGILVVGYLFNLIL